jgi:hypothetical protein
MPNCSQGARLLHLGVVLCLLLLCSSTLSSKDVPAKPATSEAAPEPPNSPWQNHEKRTSGDEVCGTGKMEPFSDKSGECAGR